MSCGGIDIDATPRQSERRIKKKEEEKEEQEKIGRWGRKERERETEEEKFRFVDNTVSEYR